MIRTIRLAKQIHTALPLILRFYASSTPNKANLLCSQFHFNGIKHFQKTRQLGRSTTALFEIDKLITQLQKNRQRTIEVKDLQMIKSDEQLQNKHECAKYFQTYEKLLNKVEEIKIGEEWAFSVVGWYNMQPFLQQLIEQLLAQADKSQYLPLIQSISWMKPHQLIINTQQSIQQMIKQKNKIDHFYRSLNYGYSIKVLRQVQSIFVQAMTQVKSKFYHQYTANNCNSILRDSPKNEEIDDILWIFQQYVATFNDSPEVIKQFEDYFLLHKQDIEKIAKSFIRVYRQLGRANPQIYNHYIKPFLAQTPSNIIEVQILNLQFLIHSQIDDQQALNQTFKKIAKIAKVQAISHGHRLHIHYLMHYLKIKNIPFNFPFTLFREFNQVCRTFEEDAVLAKKMAIQLDEKSRKQGVEYYNSNCVLKKKQFEGKQKEQGKQIKKVEGFKQFTNIKFCCLNIDLCVYDQVNKKAIILQKNYHKFYQSGRLTKGQEIKDTVLRHYGFEINYLQTKHEQSKRSLSDQLK